MLVTTRKDDECSFPCVFIEDCGDLELENVQSILFERLLLANVEANLVGASNAFETLTQREKHLVELAKRKKAVTYLIEVYKRAKQEKNENLQKVVLESVACNMKTIIQQPDVIENQDVHKQFQDLILHDVPNCLETSEFVNIVLNGLYEEKNLCVPLLESVSF